MTRVGAIVAAVTLVIILPCCIDCIPAIAELPQINAVRGSGEIGAIVGVHFMVTIRLSIFIDVITGHLVSPNIGWLAFARRRDFDRFPPTAGFGSRRKAGVIRHGRVVIVTSSTRTYFTINAAAFAAISSRFFHI
jgi:hypothetical protein